MTLTLIVLCVEDEPDVLDAIVRDLAPFESVIRVEGVSSAYEARELIEGLDASRERVALIYCDHVMPGQRGVDFLTDLAQQPPAAAAAARKVLFTGQAGHEDTIQAINRAHIEHYLSKPWEPRQLNRITRQLLTDFVLAEELSPLPFMQVLDQERVVRSLHDQGLISDT